MFVTTYTTYFKFNQLNHSCVNELLSAVGNDTLHSKEAVLFPSLCTCMTCILMLFMYGFDASIDNICSMLHDVPQCK